MLRNRTEIQSQYEVVLLEELAPQDQQAGAARHRSGRARRRKDTGIFDQLFDYVVLQGVKAGYIDGHTLFGDSSHLKANANKRYLAKEGTNGVTAEMTATARERLAPPICWKLFSGCHPRAEEETYHRAERRQWQEASGADGGANSVETVEE